MSLVLGRITYANTIPFFHYLRACGYSGRICDGVPSELNRLLASGRIDASPSSSFEYAEHWRDYLILPQLSISSCGAVQSVLLFTRRPLDQLHEEEILLTGESATSVRLLEVLLREFVGLPRVHARIPEGVVEEHLEQGRSMLLIGDRALRARQGLPPEVDVHDLGSLWHRYTGLPFVFALWMTRREAALKSPEEVGRLLRALHSSLARAQADLAGLASHYPQYRWLGDQGLSEYWRNVSYELGEEQLAGLKLYYRLLVKYGMLAAEPELHFFGERIPEGQRRVDCLR